jgi:hypothetical protein
MCKIWLAVKVPPANEFADRLRGTTDAVSHFFDRMSGERLQYRPFEEQMAA